MSYYLLLDDIRSITDVLIYTKLPTIPNDEWVIVRSYKEFVDTIIKNGLPTYITYDHDLSDNHYGHGLHNDQIPYEKYTEKTGMHCAKWLVEYCMKYGVKHPKYTVHSMNPVGKFNIISYIESYNKLYINT